MPATAFARAGLPRALRFEGHAIVTADGRIADAAGGMPEALRNAEDWRRFQAALDASALVVLGRLGHQRHPNPGRPRLVLTASVTAIGPDGPNATRYNPAGASLAAVLAQLGLDAADAGERTFFRGRGCPQCGQTRYRGRLGLFEWLPVTEPIRDLIGEKARVQLIRRQAIAEGMRSLREEGRRAMFAGATTAEEVMKYT